MNDMILAVTDNLPIGVILGVAGVAIAFGLLVFIAKHMVVGDPSELLVISGKQSGDGMGYRTLIGGRTFVIPILEKVQRLTLRNMQVGLEVKAQSGGGTMIPIVVTGVANVKVSSDPEIRGNAIERFLNQPAEKMQLVARETLEGGLRAVIGKMTPQEIVEDRDKFVATVMNEVVDDFRKLGLIIDSVNIQNVHDEEQYLVSIARKASAEVRASARQYEAQRTSEAEIKEAEALAASRKAKAQREAEAMAAEAQAAALARQAKADRDSEAKVAEAKAAAQARQAQAERDAEAQQAEAAGRQKAEMARLAAEKAIAESENALRIRKAELAREAAIKEADRNRAAADAESARLQATEVAQAQARRDVAKAEAEGAAATVLEEGIARAAAIERIGQAIAANPEALKVMLVEMMPGIVEQVGKNVANMQLGQISVVDGGNGHAVAGAAMSRARTLSETLAAVQSIVGVDLREVSQAIAEKVSDGHATSSRRATPSSGGPRNPPGGGSAASKNTTAVTPTAPRTPGGAPANRTPPEPTKV